jgi:hypothetical protein
VDRLAARLWAAGGLTNGPLLFRFSLYRGPEALTSNGANGAGGHEREPSDVSAAAQVRASGEDFSTSFLELQEMVRESCGREVRWEAKVVAAIHATLDFAAANPVKATALTLNARRPNFGDRNPEQIVIDHFVDLLGEVASTQRRLPVPPDRAIVESIFAIVRGHLVAGTADRLPEVAPDAAYLALLPYLGLEATRRWAEPAGSLRG